MTVDHLFPTMASDRECAVSWSGEPFGSQATALAKPDGEESSLGTFCVVWHVPSSPSTARGT